MPTIWAGGDQRPDAEVRDSSAPPGQDGTKELMEISGLADAVDRPDPGWEVSVATLYSLFFMGQHSPCGWWLSASIRTPLQHPLDAHHHSSVRIGVVTVVVLHVQGLGRKSGTGRPPGAQHGDGAQPTAGRGLSPGTLHVAAFLTGSGSQLGKDRLPSPERLSPWGVRTCQ